MASTKLRIAVIGLGFGVDFVPIYLRHPNVSEVAICDANEKRLESAGARFEIRDRFTRFEQVLESGYDAVHILTPVRFHVEQTLAALEAGLHVACAVPMATTIEDLRKIVAAQRRTGKNYMMMETAVYTREFLFAEELQRRGEFGNLTFLRGAHMQDIEGLPEYWYGYPFMLYATHAVSPVLALTGTRAAKVCCFGAGTLRDDLRKFEGNPFPMETAIMRLHGTDIAAEITGSFFQNARPYVESFCAYGDRMGFEWPQMEDEDPYLFHLNPLSPGDWGRGVRRERVSVPFRPDLLPAEIAEFTVHGGHGGSHPHLVHEFVTSILEERAPRVDAVTAANWTAPGICAHASTLQEGEPVVVPDFD